MMSKEEYKKGLGELKKILGDPIWENNVPNGFVNNVDGWGFSKKIIEENSGKLLTLDIDFGKACSLNCPHCFRKENKVDENKDMDLNVSNIQNIILQAKKLGLKSVKFLGAGDPLEYDQLIPFLKFLHEKNIIPLIFTKGHVIASDKLVKKIHGANGIETGQQLVQKMKEFNVSILFGYNSCCKITQNNIVGNDNNLKDMDLDYFSARNKALEILIKEEKYNKFIPNKASKLAFAMNPVTEENIGEIYDIYVLIRKRNIYPIVTPTMMSGRGRKKWKDSMPEIDKLIKLYKDIYEFNKNFGIQKSIDIDSISPYAGGHVCNQTAVGLYITLDGTILSCPGDNQIEGKIDKSTIDNPNDNQLESIWKQSKNYTKRKGKHNCYCIAKDGYSIPYGFYNIVVDQINEKNNDFQKLINILEYKLMFDWYKDNVEKNDNQKYIGVSIQVEREQQNNDSPTRKCLKGKESPTKKMINSFCLEVQNKGKDAVAACNKLDYYLKKRIKKEEKYKGIICRCHEGVSNIIFHYPYRYSNKNTGDIKIIDLYVFIGHILCSGNSEATNNVLEGMQIKKLKEDEIMLNEKYFIKKHDSISKTEDIKYKDYDISQFNTDELAVLKSTIEEGIEKFLDNHIDDLQYGNYDALVNGITIENITKKLIDLRKDFKRLYTLIEEDKEIEVDDLLNNVQYYINSIKVINNNQLAKIKDWIEDGLKGMVLTDNWIDNGKKLKLSES